MGQTDIGNSVATKVWNSCKIGGYQASKWKSVIWGQEARPGSDA